MFDWLQYDGSLSISAITISFVVSLVLAIASSKIFEFLDDRGIFWNNIGALIFWCVCTVLLLCCYVLLVIFISYKQQNNEPISTPDIAITMQKEQDNQVQDTQAKIISDSDGVSYIFDTDGTLYIINNDGTYSVFTNNK